MLGGGGGGGGCARWEEGVLRGMGVGGVQRVREYQTSRRGTPSLRMGSAVCVCALRE